MGCHVREHPMTGPPPLWTVLQMGWFGEAAKAEVQTPSAHGLPEVLVHPPISAHNCQ